MPMCFVKEEDLVNWLALQAFSCLSLEQLSYTLTFLRLEASFDFSFE
jgi:hypothetical protein